MEQLILKRTMVRFLLLSSLLMLGLEVAPAGAAEETLGYWDIKVEFGEREFPVKLRIFQTEDGELTGTWSSQWGENVLSDVKFEEGKLTFTRKSTYSDRERTSTFEATISGDTLKGIIKSERGEAPATGQRGGPEVVGKWELTSTSQRGPRTRILTIKENMTGTYQFRDDEIAVKELKLEGDQLSFKVERTRGESSVTMEFKGRVEGKTLTGEFVTQRGSNKITGKKITNESEAAGASAQTRRGQDSQGQPLTAEEKAKALSSLRELVEKVKAEKEIAPEKLEESAAIVSVAAQALEPEVLLAELKELQKSRKDTIIPGPQQKLTADKKLDWEIFSAQVRALKKVSPEKVEAHPAAVGFPGAVPARADRITRQIAIVTDRPGWHNNGIYGNPQSPYWHSTGLYAAPGEVITVTVDESVIDKGLYVRIGCHSDLLWRARSWSRAPDITRRYAITQTNTKAANAFGGLVYIETPRELTLPEFKVTIADAVAAPYYQYGKTTPQQWREQQNSPAPWAELQNDKLILTLPADDVRQLNDPGKVMDFWNGIMDLYAEFLGKPTQRRRIERFVSDIQISAGYMHSGYPLMVGLDITKTMIDIDKIKNNEHHGVWGLFHEIGHNHQNRDWTFGGTTEVTVNLFSLYVMDKACGMYLDGHPSVKKQVRANKIKKYFGEGSDFNQWKSDPFLALAMYIQLIEEFGWEPFQKVFADYRELSEAERPRSDDQKRDQWMVRFSRRTGRNLGPFFEAWGVPTSAEARASIAALPTWMPEDLPTN